jgi:propionate CoA-transferase
MNVPRWASTRLNRISPGIDIGRDVMAHMDFRPTIVGNVKTMDKRLFLPQLMGMAADIASRQHVKRTR